MEVGDDCLLTEESVLNIWDNMKKIARKKKGKIKSIASNKKVRASRGGQSVTLHAMAHVSPFFWESVENIYTTRCDTLLNPQCRIKQVMVGEGADAVEGYTIDNIILIPVEEVTELEECIDKRILFVYLTFGGNFQLGGSFVDTRGAGNLGMRVVDEGAVLNSKEGQITIASHALFSGTILNKNLAIGAQTLVDVEA